MTVDDGPVPAIRFATEADLDALAAIEDDADRLFLERFRPEAWSPAPSGRSRAEQPGFLLVAGEREDGAAEGFAHVLEVDGGAHLEQLAVRVASARRGYGRALVLAALAEAGRRGYDRVTLRTYADVPWNAPFYARLGFVETEPDTDRLRALIAEESRFDLERYGRRVQMTARTTAENEVLGPR
jgi:GNAT superfamily N-acetyltransferase